MATLAIPNLHAANQTEICKAQCAAYELAWQDHYCYQFVKEMCSKGDAETGLEMADFWASMVESEASYWIFVSAYACVDVIDDCIVPINTACANSCNANNLGYAPDLIVSRLYYLEEDGVLETTVANRGLAYIEGAYATAYYGYSDSINDSPTMTKIGEWDVPALRPRNVRWSPEDLNWDYYHNVTYPIKAGKYNVFKVFVHTDPKFTEGSVNNNAMIYVVNDLPRPAELWIDSATATRYGGKTDTFTVDAKITNKGELPADAEVRYYLGSPRLNQLAASETVRVDAGDKAESEQQVVFQPGSTYLTVQLVSEGNVIMERTLYPNPAFFYIEGRVTDEAGRPIPGAIVQVGPFSYSDFPLQSGDAIVTIADEAGHYELPAVFTEEGTVSVYSRKPGYFTNSTNVTLTYESDRAFWDYERTITADLILTQEPVQVSMDYPARAKYIIETDKGRFTGDYAPGGVIPVQGANGTIFMASENCSYFVGKFNTSYQHGYLDYRPNVTCIAPDTNDDYTLLQKPELLWNKSFSGEEPRVVVFDRRGDHVYVLTADTGTNFNNVYGYDLVTGNQQFKFESGANGIQRSVVMPAYDGSQVYLGMLGPRYAKTGENQSKGYLVSESGQILYTWLFPETTETLLDSSAGSMAELVQYRLFFYAPGDIMLKQCNLVKDKPCEGASKSPTIDLLGISKNRAIGSCNSTSCVFRPAYDDVVMLDRHYANPVASGDYANDDVFVADYKGGSYYHNGDKAWGTDKDTVGVSMSPGGSYVVLVYDSHGMEVFAPDGDSLYSSDVMATGAEATERGIFYATHQGNRLSIYRLSTMTEPSSTTTTTGGTLHTGFVDQFFQALVDIYNAFMQWISSLFG